MEWENIDNYHERAKVVGGWLVKAYVHIEHANIDSIGYWHRDQGQEMQVTMAFVPDAKHEWVIDGCEMKKGSYVPSMGDEQVIDEYRKASEFARTHPINVADAIIALRECGGDIEKLNRMGALSVMSGISIFEQIKKVVK